MQLPQRNFGNFHQHARKAKTESETSAPFCGNLCWGKTEDDIVSYETIASTNKKMMMKVKRLVFLRLCMALLVSFVAMHVVILLRATRERMEDPALITHLSRFDKAEWGANKTENDGFVTQVWKLTKNNNVADNHVVFLGDTHLRYLFLEWLDRNHFERNEREFAPSELVNEKLHPSWASYFNYSTQHFEGQMTCDCRRGEIFDITRETENRYYRSNKNELYATYLQGYGDTEAHGRFGPEDVWDSKITSENDTTPYKWRYTGTTWNELIENQIAKLKPKPLALVMNAGLWPNNEITRKLGSIVQAARDALGPSGIVHWRSTAKLRDSSIAHQSAADIAAQEWSFRVPWLHYEPFPMINDITESDYFDDKHFSNGRIYREWNKGLGVSLQPPDTTLHRMFIMVGAARTLEATIESYMMNFVFPLCPPPRCVAHLVVHLSSADNRPSVKADDPRGEAKPAGKPVDIVGFLHHALPAWPGTLYIHEVGGYDIGSPEEQAAMDLVEAHVTSTTLRDRLHMLRTADPRRYSMWFSRAWAWQSAEKVVSDYSFDLFAFTRPDLLWLLPVPTAAFFKHFGQSGAENRDVWVHDTYYSNVPDTFALFASAQAASFYFSAEKLVEPGIACLGGPNFNQSVVKERLSKVDIFPKPTDWCSTITLGWSERILGRKLKASGLVSRPFPAGVIILRPPLKPDCQSIHPKRQNGFAKWNKNYAPLLACLSAEQDFKSGITNVTSMLSRRPFQLRGMNRATYPTCLSLVDTSPANATLIERPCDYPIPPDQIFVGTAQHPIMGYNAPLNKLVLPDIGLDMAELGKQWTMEPCQLYGLKTFDARS